MSCLIPIGLEGVEEVGPVEIAETINEEVKLEQGVVTLPLTRTPSTAEVANCW